MKKLTFLLATLLVGGMMLTGCKKDDPNNNGGGETPTTTTKTVVYRMDNSIKAALGITMTVSPCFHYTFSYKDADGNMVEVNDPTLPWSKEITVTPPFEAQLKGTVSYDESEILSPVYFGRLGSITQDLKHTIEEPVQSFDDKDDFIEYITARPQKLEYNFTLPVE